MQTIYTLKSAKDASKYYQKENYYAKDNPQERPFSTWYGKGSEILGLQGEINFQQLEQTLKGILPNGVEMIQKQKGMLHRPGYDLTFSAPKSVSILGIVGKDERIIQAHRNAVFKILSHIEEKYGSTRVKKNGVIHIERANNLTFATFEHTDSRELDPNLHTHCVLMNFTQREDGEWRTIYADELYQDKLLNGMEYRVELAKELRVCGFEIVQTSEKGTFELADFDERLIKQFSKRRHQIEEKLDEIGQSGGKMSQVANFLTRKGKRNIDPNILQLQWEHELEACGSNMEWLKNYSKDAKERDPLVSPDPSLAAIKAVESAMRHLSERKSVFSMQDLLKASRGMSLNCESTSLIQTIHAKIKQNQLLHLGDELFTTPKAKENEKQVAELMHQDRNQVKPLCSQFIAGLTAKFRLKDKEQQEILKQLLTQYDRQVVVQTSSHESYYSLLKGLNKSCQDHDYYPIGIAASHTKKDQMKTKSGISWAYTLDGFLEACQRRFQKSKGHVSERKQYEARQLWIVDPSVKMSMNQAIELQERAQYFGARIIWSGQPSRSNPVLSLLIKEGISHYSLEKKLVRDAQNDTLKILCQSEKMQINEIVDYQDRINQVAQNYVSFLTDNPALIVATHADRIAVNQVIREKLISESKLGEATQIRILHPITFSEEQKCQFHLYQPGDVLHFRSEYKRSNISKNSYYFVQDIDFKNQILLLESNDGTVLEWDPSKTANKQVSIYRAEARELRIGDQIAWTKTILDKNDELFNRRHGETAEVISFDEKGVSLCLQNGKEFYLNKFDLSQLHLDYGYVTLLSNIKSQAEHGILLMTSNQAPLLDHDALFSLINKSKQFDLICDSVDEIQNFLRNQTKQPYFATQKEVVAYDSENQKPNTLMNELKPFARLQSAVEGINREHTQNEIENRSETLKIAFEAVDYVCSRLVGRNATFSLEEAKKEVYQLIGLRTSKEDIENAFNVAIQNKLLVELGGIKGDVNETRVTTAEMLAIEKACLECVKHNQGSVTAILPADHISIKAIESNKNLTMGQKEAILLTLATPDRVIGIQGVAGAGKTTMLKEVHRVCRDAGFNILGLAHTAGAKNRIEEATSTLHAAGIPAMTTRKFLNHATKLLEKEPELAKSLYGTNQIVVLDEASMISTRDMLSIFSLVERLDARLLLMGDVKQLGAIEAGNPWYLLLGSTMKSVSMKENVRFKDPQAVAIMRDLYAARIDDAIDKLSINIAEVQNYEERISAIANFYVGKSQEDRAKTLVISPKNEDRIQINNKIRELLKEKSILKGTEFEAQVLLPKDISQIEKNHFYSYQEGDFIRFNFNNKRLVIEAGDYLEVIQKDPNTQLLTLKGIDDRYVLWSPRELPKWSGAIEIFEKERKGLMVGDKIRWRKNDENRGIINGEVAEVIKIEGPNSEIKLRNGDKIELNLEQYINQHWDHSYSSTVFVAQGQDVKFTVGLCQGPRPYYSKDGKAYYPPLKDRKKHELPNSTTLSGFLVQATRGDDFVMFVDNIASFKDTLQAQPGLKETAMQYLDPEWAVMEKKVKEMTANVTGKILKKEGSSESAVVNEKISRKSPLQNKQLTSKTTSSFESKIDFNARKEAVIEQLHSNIIGYVTNWLGNPTHLTKREARWGKHGSFSILLNGPAMGTWSDFEKGVHGRDLLSLYMETYQLTFKEAMKHFSKQRELNRVAKGYLSFQRHAANDKRDVNFNQNKISFALKTYEKGSPIQGTLAEKYLRAYRGITGDLPEDFRFCSALKHPHTHRFMPALLAPIRDGKRDFIGVVRIFLDPDGSKLKTTITDLVGKEMKVPSKANLGLTKGGAVRVQKGRSNTLWVAEGIETALSVAKAQPSEDVIASLSVSQLKGIPVGAEKQKIVICADNDGEHLHSRKAILQAVEHHLSKGYRVYIAMPSGEEKCDFNDVLKQRGIQAVKQILEQRMEIKSTMHLDQTLFRLKSMNQAFTELTTKSLLIKQDSKELI